MQQSGRLQEAVVYRKNQENKLKRKYMTLLANKLETEHTISHWCYNPPFPL